MFQALLDHARAALDAMSELGALGHVNMQRALGGACHVLDAKGLLAEDQFGALTHGTLLAWVAVAAIALRK